MIKQINKLREKANLIRRKTIVVEPAESFGFSPDQCEFMYLTGEVPVGTPGWAGCHQRTDSGKAALPSGHQDLWQAEDIDGMFGT